MDYDAITLGDAETLIADWVQTPRLREVMVGQLRELGYLVVPPAGICGWCHDEAKGLAQIAGIRYCHQRDPGENKVNTCYERASHAVSFNFPPFEDHRSSALSTRNEDTASDTPQG